ncbi:hypothetical protein C5167_005431 [Papaver somniferum]|uniref:Uncharacterized protein n=1 Tax=Papaver somniferum TaxID=3469 RepID=A0A4Y7JDP8_PAPSO|nr:GATA zinc finger domain-containing protein 14-like [Papaver somniferum]RZC58120.1 hypothetical protein C5167_005431 [Papaver somniferum]
MADSFWFWSNITDISSIIDDDQNIRGGGGGRRGYNQGCQEQEMNMNYTGVGVAGGRRYNEGGQEQEMNMMRSMMTSFEDDDHHQNTTATKKTKAIKKCGGRTCQKKPEKKTPKRGVGIAKLEETIKQKNSLLAAAADRQVYHGYPTTAEVIPTTTYNHSHQPIPFHHPFLNRQQQKQTSTVFSSSSSVVNGDANTKHVFDGGQLDLNHVPNANIHENKGYDQVMKYGSSSTATNVSNNNQLMFKSHAPQTYLLHHQQQQQHGNNEARYYNPNPNPNPNAGSGTDRQHGNNNVAGYNSRPEVAELSSTQKQHQNYCLSQHSDHIWLNNQKNLNNGENIGGFTRLNNKSDFLESDLGRNWNSNYNNVNGRQLKKEFTSSSSIAATPGLVPTTGYSGVTAKGKSSLSSSSSSFYEFLSLTTGGIKGHHKKADYYDQQQQYYSSNYSSSSSSCIMEESGAACSSVRNGAAHDNISSSSQSNTTTHDHEFLDLSLKLSSYH